MERFGTWICSKKVGKVSLEINFSLPSGFFLSIMIMSRLLKYNFKKTAEKCDSNSKVYKAQEVNKPQLVLVHHL